MNLIAKGFADQEQTGAIIRFYETEESTEALGSLICTWRKVIHQENNLKGIIARFGYLKVQGKNKKEIKVNCVKTAMQEIIKRLEQGDAVFYWISTRKDDLTEILTTLGFTNTSVNEDGESVWMFNMINPKRDN